VPTASCCCCCSDYLLQDKHRWNEAERVQHRNRELIVAEVHVPSRTISSPALHRTLLAAVLLLLLSSGPSVAEACNKAQ
jgi:hypothetical protein